MKTKYLPAFLLVAVGMLSLACLLPGMIPLTSGTAEATTGPMPAMEKDADKVLEALKAGNFVLLDALAQEQYTEQQYNQPGTLTFTARVTTDQPVYFRYDWCAKDEKTLEQNFEHIHVKLYFNDQELGRDVVHGITSISPTRQVCGNLGTLISNWPAGQYKLKIAATFDQKINDGVSDYGAGEYVHEYTVDVPQ